jgi:hypothetical protein
MPRTTKLEAPIEVTRRSRPTWTRRAVRLGFLPITRFTWVVPA